MDHGPLTGRSRAFFIAGAATGRRKRFDMSIFDGIKEKKRAKQLEDFKRSGVLRSFIYNYGKASDMMTTFWLYDEEDRFVFRYVSAQLREGGEYSTELRLPLTVSGEIKNFIKEQELYLWNGFNKTNSVIATGKSFSLKADFDNYRLRAEGMVMVPKDYDEKHELLKNFLEGLLKKYQIYGS